MVDIGTALIGNSTRFAHNIANQSGGALYFSCGKEQNLCNLTIEVTEFTDNVAELEGGAIKWNLNEPIFNQGIKFINNSAIYGDDIASCAKYVI